MEEFGFPPVFPADEEKEEEEKADEPVIKDKAKGKKVWKRQLLIGHLHASQLEILQNLCKFSLAFDES